MCCSIFACLRKRSVTSGDQHLARADIEVRPQGSRGYSGEEYVILLSVDARCWRSGPAA